MKNLFIVLASILVYVIPVSAQNVRRADNIYYSFDFLGTKLNKEIGSLDVEQRVGVRVGGFAPFASVTVAESLYNRSSTKNYDFQGKLGIGGAYSYAFNSNDGIDLSVSWQSTVGNYDFKYSQFRFHVKYETWMMKVFRANLGVGIQYSIPYKDTFAKGKIYPCFGSSPKVCV